MCFDRAGPESWESRNIGPTIFARVRRGALLCPLFFIALRLVGAPEARENISAEAITVLPEEDAGARLHNPGMGWVLYENYPVDQDPHGSSTLLTLPEETFPGVDAVAVMFSWADIEQTEGEYDFSKPNFAYDYWRKRGKEIHLRVSSESLLWWNNRNPPAGEGVPRYVLDHLAPAEKQTRSESGLPYVVVDALNDFYQTRLRSFLTALRENFSGEAKRPVTLIDLRGFGLWGEWHSGFRYPDTHVRHDALCAILELWSRALPNHDLNVSYSYDPDGPPEFFEGPRDRFDSAATTHFDEFLKFSAFDCALAIPNITFRRDGCGGAVHSNERKLCDLAFALPSKGPFVSEFLGGYAANKKGGDEWLASMITDALSLHSNYIALLGWQGGDARDFVREQPELFGRALRDMGYRLLPRKLTFAKVATSGSPLLLQSEWSNLGVGRAPRDFQLHVSLSDETGKQIAEADAGALPSRKWIKGTTYLCENIARFAQVPAGEYMLRMRIMDAATSRTIALPIRGQEKDGSFTVGKIRVQTSDL